MNTAVKFFFIVWMTLLWNGFAADHSSYSQTDEDEITIGMDVFQEDKAMACYPKTGSIHRREESWLDITPLKNTIDQLKDKEGPIENKEILIISDLDGTLTSHVDPSIYRGNFNYSVQPRGKGVEFLKEMVNEGINVVVATAWNNMDESIYRITQLGLAEILDVTSEGTHSTHQTLYTPNYYTQVEGIVNGKLVSARSNPQQHFYRNKGLAPALIPALNREDIKYIFLLDDGASNIDQSYQDFEDFNVFPNLKYAELILLTHPLNACKDVAKSTIPPYLSHLNSGRVRLRASA